MSGDPSLRSDRRQWKKSTNTSYFNFQQLSSPTEQQVEQNEAQKRYEDYLFNLHLNNQVNKIVAKKDKKQEELERLENGFNLFTNGAHQSKEKYTPRYTTASKSSMNSKKSQHFTPRTNCKSTPLLRYFEEQQQELQSGAFTARSDRKRWENASFCIKTTDGCQIKISAPNRYDSKAEVSTFSANKKTNGKDGKKDKTDPHYSYDFESDSNDEEEVTNRNGQVVKQLLSDDKNLIESVQFSDFSDEDGADSDIEDQRENQALPKKKKDFVFQLSSNDVKKLRESMNETNLSLIRESLLVSKEQQQQNDTDNDLETIEEDSSSFNLSTDNSIETSSMCDFIIKQAVGLKKE